MTTMVAYKKVLGSIIDVGQEAIADTLKAAWNK